MSREGAFLIVAGAVWAGLAAILVLAAGTILYRHAGSISRRARIAAKLADLPRAQPSGLARVEQGLAPLPPGTIRSDQRFDGPLPPPAPRKEEAQTAQGANGQGPGRH